MTRPAPCLSAIMPSSGVLIPHMMFCTAIAKPNDSRVNPRSPVIGNWNSPIPWRIPIEKFTINAPARSTTTGVRQFFSMLLPDDVYASAAVKSPLPISLLALPFGASLIGKCINAAPIANMMSMYHIQS
jgi:hypothetical protein